jgi:hypothetical protein
VEPTAPSTGEACQVVHPVSLIAGLLTMLLALGLVILAAQPPAPQAESASPNRFAAGRAMATLNRLLDDGAPHPIGSDANARVGDRIASELTALGYPVEFQTSFACRLEWAICGQVTNIMTRLPGAAVGPAVLLTAHYDSVAAGPGAADDMAGVAAILEIARTLQVKDEPPLSSRPGHPHRDEGHVGRPRGDDRVAGDEVLQLQLRLPQGERQVSLYVPQAAGLTRTDITGTRYTFDEIPAEDGYQRFHCFGPSCDGLSLTLHLEMGETPAALLVVSSASDLPEGGERLIAARPKTAAPSGSGDATLVIDRVTLDRP